MLNRGRRQCATMLGALMFILAGLAAALAAATPPPRSGLPSIASGAPGGPPGQPLPAAPPVPVGTHGVAVGQAYHHDISPPARTLKSRPPASGPHEPAEHENPSLPLPPRPDAPDPVVQRHFQPSGTMNLAAMPPPLTNWAGIAAAGAGGGGCWCSPADTNGDVGPNHYVQVVNDAFQIWTKTGISLYGPANNNTLWQGFGGLCETKNDGDPIVLYDPIADRWLLSQLAFTSVGPAGAPQGPYDECIAISTTPDPTGTWYRYAFQLNNTTLFHDYPKLGVWPDGYYMSAALFDVSLPPKDMYQGTAVVVFNRNAMLTGAPTTYQAFALKGPTQPYVLPADLDGSILPWPGTPNVFLGFGNPMPLYKFHVDWATPANTTFNLAATLATAPFTLLCPNWPYCLAQNNTAQVLDGLGDRLMNRLAYRRFADGHEALVVTANVDAGPVGARHAGVRWYEIRNPSSAPTISQQGTYAPDANSRWMGSAAMNKFGDIAVGYNVTSASVYLSIRYAGRYSVNALNTLPQGEGSIWAGTGSQVSTWRWGDYSAMSVDPTDDCTFWYTAAYNDSYDWHWGTRIASFKFPNCIPPTATPTLTAVPPTATRTPTVTRTPTRAPTPLPCWQLAGHAAPQAPCLSPTPIEVSPTVVEMRPRR